MTITARTRVYTALVLTIAAAAACTPDSVAAPHASATSSPKLAIATSSVVNLQLRSLPPNPVLPPNPIYGYGHVQVRLGAQLDVGTSCLPPNPISPQPGTTIVSVCGKIFNEGGARYTGGGIYLIDAFGDSFATLIASFNGAVPSDPCRRYDIAGAIVVPDAVAADMVANTTSYAVRLDGTVANAATSIGGRFDGTAWGPVGSRPETDPFFAEKVCTVAIVP
jgi:hypothetical protein